MASINKVIILGRLGQDPEMRYTQNQTAVCSLNVATTEFKQNQNGEREEMTEWHRIVVWGKQAENCGQYLAKGRGVAVEGRLQTRSWEDQNGQKRYTTEIVANNVQFLSSGQGQGQAQNNPQNNTNQNFQHNNHRNNGSGGFLPNPNQGNNRFENAPSMQPSAFDDIPF